MSMQFPSLRHLGGIGVGRSVTVAVPGGFSIDGFRFYRQRTVNFAFIVIWGFLDFARVGSEINNTIASKAIALFRIAQGPSGSTIIYDLILLTKVLLRFNTQRTTHHTNYSLVSTLFPLTKLLLQLSADGQPIVSTSEYF